MKQILLLAAFCSLIFWSQAAEPKKISDRDIQLTAFDLLRTHIGFSRRILEIAPGAINDHAKITLKFARKADGSSEVDLGAIESAITNQTTLRLEKISKSRLKVTAPSPASKPQTKNENQSGTISFKAGEFSHALKVYGAICDSTLIITPEAIAYSGRVTFQAEGSRSEIREKIAEVIAAQTPVRVTRLDENHVAVTLRDQPVPSLSEP